MYSDDFGTYENEPYSDDLQDFSDDEAWYDAQAERDYDAYEAAQLQKLDEILDGDWGPEDRYLDAAYEDRYYEPEADFDIY